MCVGEFESPSSSSCPNSSLEILIIFFSDFRRTLCELSAGGKDITDSSSSSVTDLSESEYTDDESLEHRSTLTEILPQAIQQIRLDKM